MISQTFITQWSNPTKGDWSELVKDDLETFGISDDLSKIKAKSRFSFKALIKDKSKELTLLILLNQKENHSKLNNLRYSELKMQNYLQNPKISVREARILFKFRTRMIPCWKNFKGERPPQQCQICRDPTTVDEQEHMMECIKIKENITIEGKYNDIFKTNIDEKIARTVGKPKTGIN